MNRRSKKAIVMVAILLVLALLGIKANARPTVDYTQPHKIRTTCYLPTGNRTASGTVPTENVTIAARREWIGKTIALYRCKRDGSIGSFIGYFVVEDTGGALIRSGQRLDVFRNNMASARRWVRTFGDYTYYMVIPSKG